MGGNFKVRCVDNCGNNLTAYTVGKIYEVKDGKLTTNNGMVLPGHGCFDTLEDLRRFSSSKWELVTEKEYSGEYISIKRCKKGKRVVAVMSMDGVFQKSVNVKLNDFDGNFEKAAKAALDKLLGNATVNEIEAVDKADGNFKARCVATRDYGLEVGKVYEFVNGFSHWKNGQIMPQYDRKGISKFRNFRDLIEWFGEGNTTKWEEVKEETPLTVSNSKVGKNGVEIRDTIKVLGSDHRENKYTVGGVYKVLDIESDGYPRVIEGSVFGVVTEDFEIVRKASDKPEIAVPLTADGFKVGDRVRATILVGNDSVKDATGTIIYMTGYDATVEFDQYINGHKGACGKVQGKYGYCWYVGFDNLCKITDDTINIQPSFDWESFKSGKLAVHCDTEEKAREFLKECGDRKIYWAGEHTIPNHTNFDMYKAETCYNLNSCESITYADMPFYKKEGYTIIDYTPSKPTVKEVSRQGKIGEYIKLTAKVDSCEVGIILKVEELTHIRDCGVYVTLSSGKKCICNEKYVVLEGYIPEDRPAVKEVSREAKVGEWVKVLRLDCFTEKDCKVGDIFQTVKPACEYPQSNGAYYDEDAKGDCKYISLGDYVVLENYTPDNTPIDSKPEEPKPTDTTINVGDTVKVINKGNTCDLYRDFIVKYAKDFISKFESHYVPKNGDTGIVVGSGKHDFGGDYYAVLSKDKVFCIGKKAIEKVNDNLI